MVAFKVSKTAMLTLSRISHISCRSFVTTRPKSTNVTKETDGPVTVIGINRPSKKNAVNQQTAQELREKFVEFENNSEEKIAILHGHGGTFCSGYDLSEVRRMKKEDVINFMKSSDGPMGPTRMPLKKPVIAAIDGYAVAGGLELAVMCDLRVADESAILGVFCRRYGVPLIDGGTIRLPALIGLSRAMDLIMTGRSITAQEAFDIGLVNRVVKNGTALSKAIELANQLTKLPQVCMLTDMKSAYNATYNNGNLKEFFEKEAEYGMQALMDLLSDDNQDSLSKYKD